MKVMVVLGTRPEVIKMAPVLIALHDASIETILCTTGQHREMLSQALDVFSLTPDIALDVMRENQSLNSLSVRLISELDSVIEIHKPDWIFVQGDTTTALCGALAAFHRSIKVGHVEAGLRTGDLASPFPEEGNRSLIAKIATLHFAPTHAAFNALMSENISETDIIVTGNTVVDTLEMMRPRIEVALKKSLISNLLGCKNDTPLILVTCHRRENFGGPLEAICDMLNRLATRYPTYQWVFPVHLNPNVQEPVRRILSGHKNLTLLPPQDYLTSLSLISRSILVVSDSGGIQEEAPSFGVPVVVMRMHTEREEGVRAGYATLAGQDARNIEEAVCGWLDNPEKRQALKKQKSPYGDGLASQRIIARLKTGHAEPFNG